VINKLKISFPYKVILKFVHFFFIIPVLVFISVDKLILYFAPKVFKPEILMAESGFKIFMWVWILFISFTLVYYFYISMFKALTLFWLRFSFSILFFLLFIIALSDFTEYDSRVDYAIMGYFFLYYLYFFLSLWVIKKKSHIYKFHLYS